MREFLFFFTAFMLGIAFLTFPAASTLLTSSEFQGISAHQYGFLFVPFIATTILASLLSGPFVEKWGLKGFFLLGTFFCTASMLLFFASAELNYFWLLLSTACLGIGFGSLITVFTPYMMRFYPKHLSVAVLLIYGVQCLGSCVSPLFFNWAYKMGAWWASPLIIAILFVLLFFSGLALLDSKKKDPTTAKKVEKLRRLPDAIWLFFITMFLYGTASTIFSNWAGIFIHQELGLPGEIASFALSLLWGFTLIARLLIVGFKKSVGLSYLWTPLLAAICFFIVPWMESAEKILILFSLAGIAFSVTFPLTFGYATQAFSHLGSAIPGLLTTAYILGYGVASYGVGFLYDILNISLTDVFFYSCLLGLGLLVCVNLIRKKQYL